MAGDDEWAKFNLQEPGQAPVQGVLGATAPEAPDEFAKFNLQEPPPPAYRGSILPLSRSSEGAIQFDPSAGVLGMLFGLASDAKKAATLPGRVYSGETQLPATFDPAIDDPRAKPIIGEATNFATMFGPNVNPMVRSGDRAISGAARVAPDITQAVVPSWQTLKAEGGDLHKAVRDIPVQYNPDYVPILGSDIRQELIKDGVFPENAKALYKSLDRMSTPAGPGTPVFEPANLIAMRQSIADFFDKPNVNKHGVSVALKHIDNFIENPPAAAILSGPADQVSAQYARARANSAAGFRGEELGKIARAARFRGNDVIEPMVTSAILNAKRLRGFTPEEVAKLEAVPEAGVGRNMISQAGEFLSGSGGPSGAVRAGLGTAAAHAMGFSPTVSAMFGAGVPALGAGLQHLAGKSAAAALREADLATRRRSPLFQESLAGQDLVPGNPIRDALARTIANRALQPGEQ